MADGASSPQINPVRRLTRADLPVFARTVAIAFVGGAIFNALNLPLPWMLGAMLATGSVTLMRIETNMDIRLRTLMIVVLGVLLGSAFSPEILDRAALWPITLVSLAGYVLLSTVSGYVYFRLAGFEPKTAFFSGVPGGLNEMVTLTGAMGGDERQVSVAHTTRIFLVVMVLPFLFRLIEDFEPGLRTFSGDGAAFTLVDIALLAGSAVAGLYAARFLRLPAPHLTGPMVASAAVHLIGLTNASPPVIVVAFAQILLGASVGARFAGLTYRDLGRVLRLGGIATVIMLFITGIFAVGLNALTGIPFASIVLAFSPGGLTEMSLVALALNVDTAFVATHHIVRITVVVMLIPFLFKIMRARGLID
ncbi:MAG: AbrB family transcriptional regulator [Alphaproteobacteria bacterium]